MSMEILSKSQINPRPFEPSKGTRRPIIDKWSRNNPHPAHVCHFAGLSQAEAVCATVDPPRLTSKAEKDANRHTPQTKYVTLMKGLNDVPVCTVLQRLVEMERARKLKGKKVPSIDTRSQSCPEGLRVDEIGDFKLELVRRHNPHARRVCHIEGLNGVPVCVVRDELNAEWENRFIVSPGSLAPAFSKPRKKFNWDNVKSSDFSNLNTERNMSRSSSRVSVPKMSLIPPDHCNSDLNDELDSIQALDILCSILQTNSLQTVQAWIEQATEEERSVVLRALRDMKERGILNKPSVYTKSLAALPENDVSVSYKRKWNQNKSLEEAAEAVVETKPSPPPPPPPPAKTPVGTQTPVSVLSSRKTDRPPTRIQMTGLSRSSSPAASTKCAGTRPNTMKSVREKFMTGRSDTSMAAKDPGFSWTVKNPNKDVVTKA